MKKSKKILIIGCGIAGITTANLLANKGFNVTIYEKKSFIGGNCYDYYDKNGVLIHKFGPHIFHTNYENVWKYLNKYSKFNNYINKVLVYIDKKYLQMPINLNSIEKLFPNEFDQFLEEVKNLNLYDKYISIIELSNLLKTQVSKNIIDYIFKNVFITYSSKMWGLPIDKIDKTIIGRVKIAINREWNYFPNDKYYGLPINGYTKMFEKMLNHKNIKLYLNTNINDFKVNKNRLYVNDVYYDYVIYTGSIDELFEYKFGELEYRSLEFKFKNYNKEYYQQIGVINYPKKKKITRICEYKYLTMQNCKSTTISKEYPNKYNKDAKKWNIRFYPINTSENINKYNKYKKMANSIKNLILFGRLAEYKYYDMDDIVYNAINIVKKIK